ncbi:phosphoserine aminotransferase 1, chloroplastic-like [Cornus florida]|uniref:phosphoserine aminotransferase 1, chloroplastic-like n=1 Tax=Cornus florida TaxID=4283 RepID=UPI00289C111C|nr:phosphoserine aminotransferase 1, chloroplastic-like [Cornus florida]
MAMLVTSPHYLLLQNLNHHLLKSPNTVTTTYFNAFPLNQSSRLNKPISITCSITQIQDCPTFSSQSQDRVFNFAAGPTTLPENVLKTAESKLYNWRGAGMSVIEMSHRGKEFLSIIQKVESDLHTLFIIPSDYAVLFLQGGGDKAFKEATKYCKPCVIWSGKSEKYTKIPSFDQLEQNLHAKYWHICANVETWVKEKRQRKNEAGDDRVILVPLKMLEQRVKSE